VGRLVGRLERHETVGDQAPLGFRDPSRCLEQVDRLRAEPRTLDFEKVIETVERRGETVG
jgi:hypothetical protein